MPLVSQVYQSKWLTSDDLQGKAVKVTIASAGIESVRARDGGTEMKIAVAFVGAHKLLLCNATQARALAALFGDNTDGWVEKQVILAPERAPNGKLTIGVKRV